MHFYAGNGKPTNRQSWQMKFGPRPCMRVVLVECMYNRQGEVGECPLRLFVWPHKAFASSGCATAGNTRVGGLVTVNLQPRLVLRTPVRLSFVGPA